MSTRFMLQAKKLFLTYPQCDMSKEICLANVKQYLNDDKSIIIVGHEKHEDGGDHLHVYIESTKKLRITKSTELDVLAGKHGNYKTVGVAIDDKIRVIKYVTKDNDYVTYNIDVPKLLHDISNPKSKGRKSKHEGEAKIIVDKIMQGVKYDQIIRDHPVYCLNNGKKIKEFISDWSNRDEYDEEDLPSLYDWQQRLLEELQQKPDPRKVIWYVDTQGNTGKSTMKSLLVRQHNAYYATGKCQDMYYAYNKQPIVIFDIPRTHEGHVNYTAIEDFKNGMVFSTKYESKAKVFKKPHVVIFSNFEPNQLSLSQDRWDIRYIDNVSKTVLSEKPIEVTYDPIEQHHFTSNGEPIDITQFKLDIQDTDKFMLVKDSHGYHVRSERQRPERERKGKTGVPKAGRTVYDHSSPLLSKKKKEN